MNGTQTPIKLAKAALRKEITTRLANMTDGERERQSDIVTQKLLQLPEFKSSQRVSLYLNMTDEIKTIGILRHLLALNHSCFIPHYSGSDMKMVQLKSWEDYLSLPETNWKIKQPRDTDVRPDALETGGLDLVLVPGLGFTRKGDRLGRGKGYYDSYIRKCEKTGKRPLLIALAFYEQICDTIPVTEMDRAVDVVLFPEKDELN
ncbi:hypothetical protein CHS0354_007794 [Potamilus streckersoni]|uniref:5-formyltetrahydrofolate cyclo-ligase n=1 Tax=Potamilus streckersoni TaxID=2493646 RepID=A0AAE0TFR6_9BIVA|nr:hypothetical protein CHS0354_007794 [Potamilus streckersoni]